jgi:hypothetical protein
MAVELNKKAFDHAKQLINERKVVLDQRDDWSEDRPSAQAEDAFIADRGFGEYAKWYLGVDQKEGEETKGRYKFPYGDFQKVHRCGVIAAESRAGQYKHFDVEAAASQLLSMLDKVKTPV